MHILDGKLFPSGGGDLADLPQQKRVEVLDAAIRGIGVTTYTRTAEIRVLLSQLDFDRRCAALPESRLLLMKSSTDFILTQQVADVWDSMYRHLVETPVAKGDDPETYLHDETLAVVRQFQGVPAFITTICDASGFAKSLSAKAVYWYSTWKTETLYVAQGEDLVTHPPCKI